MPRVLLFALLTALLLVPATAARNAGVHVGGTVTAKDPAAHLVAVNASRKAFALRVSGSLAAIRLGQRVVLRGSTLRAQRRGSRVLARGVSIVSARPLSSDSSAQTAAKADDDELEINGELTSLAPVTVASSTETASCTAPAGMSLSGFAVGDLVEMKCDLVGGTWVVRKLEHDDDDAARGGEDDDDDDDGAGGGDDDDDDDSSGPGSGDDDHDDDD
jgi:hypothetical protein